MPEFYQVLAKMNGEGADYSIEVNIGDKEEAPCILLLCILF